MEKTNIQKLVGTAIVSAAVVVLQLLGSFIKFGTFSVSLVLVPIVVGAALYGTKASTWLGLVFGVTVLLSGDASLFFAINPLATILIVIVKGLLAGLITGITYRHYASKNRVFATFLAAFVCPIVNTGIFLAGCYVFFLDGIKEFAQSLGFAGSVNLFIFTVLIGGNFIFEVLFNIILCPTITRIVDIGKKS